MPPQKRNLKMLILNTGSKMKYGINNKAVCGLPRRKGRRDGRV